MRIDIVRKQDRVGSIPFPQSFDVARRMSEREAFRTASRLYTDWIRRNTPPEAAAITAVGEKILFRPAMLLQLAGLNLMSGTEMPQPTGLATSFACFAVDHLLWGWFSLAIGHPRVSLTLSRAAVEAAIFQVAATHDHVRFKKHWDSSHGTGGAVLRSLHGLPADLAWFLRSAWTLTVPLGHASRIPVTSALTTFRDGDVLRTGLTFAGQYAGPMRAEVLKQVANVFGFVAHGCVHAMRFSLRPHMRHTTEWDKKLDDLRVATTRRSHVPKRMQSHFARFREKYGGDPRRQDAE
jgi:hypothetical protein